MRPIDQRPVDLITSFAAMRRRARATNCCASCGNKNLLFRDEASRKEYAISLLCQKCQDLLFGFETFTADDFISEDEE